MAEAVRLPGHGPPRPTPLSPLTRRDIGRAPLRLPLTTFIGREREVADVCALVRRDDVHLLVLTGPGGVGKTRIALRVAESLADDFVDGVVFVALAPSTDPEIVLTTAARALGLREHDDRSPTDRLIASLRGCQVLMVFDNFEGVLVAAPDVAAVLGACPLVTALVTSRTVLHVSGEWVYPVPPLTLPDMARVPSAGQSTEAEAIRLFVERAQAVRPDLDLSDANAAAVAAICRYLDGLPLAIELAAARVTLFSPPALLARLERRLPLLTDGPREVPSRLRTMRDSIAWSYDLLDDTGRALFRHLSHFAGGFTADAVEAVAISVVASADNRDSILDGLTVLVDASLVRPTDESGRGLDTGPPRFLMLETIREFGLDQLVAAGEDQQVRQRHAAYFLALAEQAEPALSGPGQTAWLSRLEQDHANLRAALAWLSEGGRVEEALRLAGALSHFWQVHGHLTEGRHWLEGLLMDDGGSAGSTSLRAKAFSAAGTLAFMQGDADRAVACHEQSLALYREAGDKLGIAVALTNVGFHANLTGDTRRAEALLEENLTLFRELDDLHGSALALDRLGVIATLHNDGERALDLLEESLTLSRETGDEWQTAVTLSNLGLVLNHRGDYQKAEAYLMESLTLLRAVDDHRLTARVLSDLGLSAEQLGDAERAFAHFAEGLTLCWEEPGGELALARCLEGFARLAGARGQAQVAAHLFGSAQAVRSAIGSVMYPADRAINDLGVAAARGKLGDEAFVAAWEVGWHLPLEQAVAEALSTAAAPAVSGVHARRAAAARHELTARELEVLHLLVEGTSDRDIAKALGIGVRTVETHVSSLLNKLGVDSRTAAAAAAFRQRLTE